MGYLLVGAAIALISLLLGVLITVKLSAHYIDNYVSKLSPDKISAINSMLTKEEDETYSKYEGTEEERLHLNMSEDEYEEYVRIKEDNII